MKVAACLALLLTALLVACVPPQVAAPTAPSGTAPAVSRSELDPVSLAVATALTYDVRFVDLGPRDPFTPGQTDWYETNADSDGVITVEIRFGWGDCAVSCPQEHRWTYRFGATGRLFDSTDTGDAMPAGRPLPDEGSLAVRLMKGPDCATAQNPYCLNEPVSALVRARSLDGPQVVTARSDPYGLAALRMPPGRYLVSVDSGAYSNLIPPKPVVVSVGEGRYLRLFFGY